MTKKTSPFIANPKLYDANGAKLASPKSTELDKSMALQAIQKEADDLIARSVVFKQASARWDSEINECEFASDDCCSKNQGSYYC